VLVVGATVALTAMGCSGASRPNVPAPQSSNASGSAAMPTRAAAASAAKAFALMDPQDPASLYATMLSDSRVDGVAIRLDWSSLEPSGDDAYAWGRLDDALAEVKRAGKYATLHITASSYGAPPPWVYSAGAAAYSFTAPNGRSKTDPVPWDATFLRLWGDFVTDLAAHLNAAGSIDRIEYVSVTVPVPEMSLVSCRDGKLTSSISYSRAAYLDAWKTAVTVTSNAFARTRKLLPVPVGVICLPDNDGPRFFGDVLSFAQSKASDFAMFATDLNALGSQRLDGLGAQASKAPVATQFISSATADPSNRMQGSLRTAICKGLSTYHAQYFEVYKDDVRSSDNTVRDGIAAIHDSGRCGASTNA